MIIRIIIVILIFRAHSNILVQTTSFRIIIRRTITSAKKSGKTNFCSTKRALRAAKNRKNEEENKKMVKKVGENLRAKLEKNLDKDTN